MDKVIQFFKDHPIIKTLLLIVILSFALIQVTKLGLRIYTRHGQIVVIPNVTQMPLNNAIQTLDAEGFPYEISDSVYIEQAVPGTIAEQYPTANSEVKPGRKVFLTITTHSPHAIILPEVEQMSSVNAIAQLESAGFRKILIEEVPGEFDDLVMGVVCDEDTLYAGIAILPNKTLTLLVGKIEDPTLANDSLNMDSLSMDSLNRFLEELINKKRVEQNTIKENIVIREDWFD